MKNLAIVFSFLILVINIASAQQNDKLGSTSIMHQNRTETKVHSDWKKGMDVQTKKIVIRNTILGAVAGGALGKSVPFAKEVGRNLSEHHSGGHYNLESATTLKSTVIGAVVGTGIGFAVGKIKAKRRAEGKAKKKNKARKLISILAF